MDLARKHGKRKQRREEEREEEKKEELVLLKARNPWALHHQPITIQEPRVDDSLLATHLSRGLSLYAPSP